MLPFLQSSSTPSLPEGFRLETVELPSAAQLNNLLQACGESSHPEDRLMLWFDFFDHNSPRVIKAMEAFITEVKPRLNA